MSHRLKSLSLFRPILSEGLKLGQQTFFALFPLAFLMAAVEFALQPWNQPTFSDLTDWIIIFLFFLGLLVLSALHASILLRLNGIRKGRMMGLKTAMSHGIEKGIWVFSVCFLYAIIVTIASIFFIFPGIYLAVCFYFALFLVVLRGFQEETPWYRKLKTVFLESFRLVWGHWWLTAALILLILIALWFLELICMGLLDHNLVLASIFCVLTKACFIPFWYACVLTLMVELKKHH